MNIGAYAVTNAIGYAYFDSRSHDVVISIYDDALATVARDTGIVDEGQSQP